MTDQVAGVVVVVVPHRPSSLDEHEESQNKGQASNGFHLSPPRAAPRLRGATMATQAHGFL